MAVSLNYQQPVDERFGGSKLAVVATISTIGDNTILTPPTGKAIRLVWLSIIPNSDNANATLATVKLGSSTIYAAYALSHWEVFQGNVGDLLVVNLSASGMVVSVTAHYRLVP